MPEIDKAECVVVGAGPAGLAAAAALSSVGADVVLIAPSPGGGAEPDRRTTALVPASVDFLRNIEAWEAVAGAGAPLAGIRLVDDMGGLLRAPEILFSASEIGRDSLGWNVPNGPLVHALRTAIAGFVRILAEGPVSGLEIGAEQVTVALAAGHRIAARLVVAADGRNSICRQAAGIAARRWKYEQSAIATSFQHGRSHNSVSTEFHRPAGPLTTVPLPGRASSLVWVERPPFAARLAALDEAAFRAALEARLYGLLGTVGDIGSRQLFPLSGLVAERLGQSRVALVGEAAHVLPPIGAQGLNLGLADVATLADVVAGVRRAGGDVGAPSALDAYHRARTSDVARRSATTDVLNRSLTSNLLPVDLARGLGLHMLAAFPAMRRALVRRGLEPTGPRPRLMQPAIDRTPETVAS
jgi:2-octaprenyl-6-methoxyphenol hydroxylase